VDAILEVADRIRLVGMQAGVGLVLGEQQVIRLVEMDFPGSQPAVDQTGF